MNQASSGSNQFCDYQTTRDHLQRSLPQISPARRPIGWINQDGLCKTPGSQRCTASTPASFIKYNNIPLGKPSTLSDHGRLGRHNLMGGQAPGNRLVDQVEKT